jgi:hypothetical protein
LRREAAVRNLCLTVIVLSSIAAAGSAQSGSTVSTDRLAAEITQFLSAEIAPHIAGVHTFEPPQDRVLDARNGGEFSWGTFARAVAAISALSGETTIAGRDLPRFISRLCLVEARHDGKAFAQMYCALALRRFGTDLKTNALWQSLGPEEQRAWRDVLDPVRFYDREKRNVIRLAENYLGVAARLATMDYQMGIITDRALAVDIVERAAEPFVKGGIYADDARPTGRFDRYSQEYARYVYEAAENIDRKDVMAAMEPSLKTQMRLWWDLVSPDGYGYSWGRSLAEISYMDTMEIVGFLAQHPQFRPAPLPQLASEYNAAWQWLKKDYLPERHLLNVFGFGHGHYSYINPDREWQQTTAFFGKIANAHSLFVKVMKSEGISTFEAMPALPRVARFEYFRKGDRSAGVWTVRDGSLHFSLPITTGTVPGVADYLPAPHGFTGFAAPVEQTVPALTPYLELADGRVIVATDGADEIHPGEDGQSLRAVWKRWAVVGGKPAQFIDPGLTATVNWTIQGNTLTRTESIAAAQPTSIRRFSVAFPSYADRSSTALDAGRRIDRLESADGVVEVSVVNASIPLTTKIAATGNGPLGKGSRGPIPLILQFESRDVTVYPGAPLTWAITMKAKFPS